MNEINKFICNNCILDFNNLKIIKKKNIQKNDDSTTGINFPIKITEQDEEDMAILDDLLNKIYPDLTIKEYVINILAYNLSGKCLCESIFIHSGNNIDDGRIIIYKLLDIMFGKYSYLTDVKMISYPVNINDDEDEYILFEHNYNFINKRFIFINTNKNNNIISSKMLKNTISGEEILGLNPLNNETLLFKLQAICHIMSNKFTVDYFDAGIKHRLRIIPYVSRFNSNYNNTVKNYYPKDKRLNDNVFLKRLARQLLRKCWDRYIELTKINFEPILDDDKIPALITKFTNEYIYINDIIYKFINDKITEREGYRQKVKDIYSAFKKFCIDASIKDVMKQSEFQKYFERRVRCRLPCDNRIRYSYDYVLIDEGEAY